MPELPEVETTRRGIRPHCIGQTIATVALRVEKLRWPTPPLLRSTLPQQTVLAVGRRAKYLLITLPTGTLIIHLGMTGSLRILPTNVPAQKHDHMDITFQNNTVLRFRDPRRFGAILWQPHNAPLPPLLTQLGPEPLSAAFNSRYLWQRSQKTRRPIKLLLMDNHCIVGVGNIYANESLFNAGIHPETPANKLAYDQIKHLTRATKTILRQAIRAGGTTLKDFTQADGKPGYFRHALHVYARAGEPCSTCLQPIQRKLLGQRATFFCQHCQHKL